MPEYPILFNFRTTVAGRGFLAGINLDCRALLVEEEPGIWFAYGVYPSPIAASGATPLEAYADLKQGLQEALFHSAELTSNFEAFVADVQKICAQGDEVDTARWQAARIAIREGHVTPWGSLNDLPRKADASEVGSLQVVRLDEIESRRFGPEDNVVEQLQTAA